MPLAIASCSYPLHMNTRNHALRMNTRNHAPGSMVARLLIGCSLSKGPWLQGHSCAQTLTSFSYIHVFTTVLPFFSNTTLLLLHTAMQEESLFTYLTLYGVLVCCEHRSAVYGLAEHIKRYHSNTPISKRRELLALYKDLNCLRPAELTQPVPHGLPIKALGLAKDAFLCCYSSRGSRSRDGNSAVCSYISTSRVKMRQHVNQQYCVKLTRWSTPATASYKEHSEQLWQPVKVQTFFRERCYVRYFIVQEEEAQEQQQQGGQQLSV
jgi:hypothetical protein